MLRPKAEKLSLDGGPDLKDPDLYLRNEHQDVFKNLRATNPVYWNPEALFLGEGKRRSPDFQRKRN